MFAPTADQRNTVKIMAGLGVPQDKICLSVARSPAIRRSAPRAARPRVAAKAAAAPAACPVSQHCGISRKKGMARRVAGDVPSGDKQPVDVARH
jgi:hypothetical protein